MDVTTAMLRSSKAGPISTVKLGVGGLLVSNIPILAYVCITWQGEVEGILQMHYAQSVTT